MIPVTILCARVLHKKGQITVVKTNNPVIAANEAEMTLKE
jgi:hypothetical protein